MSTSQINYYWPVYLNLEKEFLEIAHVVHINDEQLGVYSMRIADLLVRTVVEIETLAKELYFANGGQNRADGLPPYFDTDCMAHLEGLWHLSKKVVLVSSPWLFLAKQENIELTPLHKAFKRGTSSANWNKGYQAVKHDRVKSLKSGNISNLLQALAALYILNLYYKDEKFPYSQKDTHLNLKDYSFGSQLFSTLNPDNFGVNVDGEVPHGGNFDKLIYFANPEPKAYKKLVDRFKAMNDQVQRVYQQEVKEDIKNLPPQTTQDEVNAFVNNKFKEVQNRIFQQQGPMLGNALIAIPYTLEINKHTI